MQKVTKILWVVIAAALGVTMVVLAVRGQSANEAAVVGPHLFALIVVLAFFAEYVDSSIGMGYGTSLTPILLLMGFSPAAIVPAVLFSECCSGLMAGLFHHRLGNFRIAGEARTWRTLWLLAACSIAGTVIAAFLFVSLPPKWIKAYIGIMIAGIGLYLILRSARPHAFRWRKIVGLGTIAAFNKGISGGGYGPLMTGGQILSGIPEKEAVAITSLAEGLTCLVGCVLYSFLRGEILTPLTLPLAIGAALSVPMAAYTVKALPAQWMKQSIGYATIFLAALTLLHAFR